MFCVCHIFLPIHCSLVATCWERAGLLVLLYVVFYCVFVTLSCGILCQVWCLIVSIPELCLLSYYVKIAFMWGDWVDSVCLWGGGGGRGGLLRKLKLMARKNGRWTQSTTRNSRQRVCTSIFRNISCNTYLRHVRYYVRVFVPLKFKRRLTNVL